MYICKETGSVSLPRRLDGWMSSGVIVQCYFGLFSLKFPLTLSKEELTLKAGLKLYQGKPPDDSKAVGSGVFPGSLKTESA